MSEEREKTQIILLRILGVLLIAVGFSMLANQVRSESGFPARMVEIVSSGGSDEGSICDRRVMHIRQTHAPAPPPPPAPPAPPAPPSPPTWSF